MKKLAKKSIAVLICLTFLLSAVSVVTAVNINAEVVVEEIEEQIQSETITLTRFGPDGSETPIEIDLELAEDEDYYDAIIEKCNELLEDDSEIQKYFDELDDGDESGTNFAFNSKVISVGRGFHFKTKLTLRFLLIKKLFTLLFPYLRLRIFRPWIVCSYTNDTKAKTVINPGSVNATNVTGNHSVLLHRFVGFALWPGRIEISPIDILPRVIVGKARFIVTI